MKKEYDYIIIGAGHCGLVLAKELVKRNKRVLILEKGDFFNGQGSLAAAFFRYDWYDGLRRSAQKVIIYRFFGVGGTGIVGCGNAVEMTDEEYNRTGIDFKGEISEAKKESFVRENGSPIGKASMRIMEVANRLGYNMGPMPKFSITGECASCGKCFYGCDYDSKWTSRECLKEMEEKNYDLVTKFSVKKIISSNGKASGVEGIGRGFKKEQFFAEKIILAAGGIGTPMILQNSGIEAGGNFYVDLYNVTYGTSQEFCQQRELPMSVVCAKFHQSEGFVMAPFIDSFVSLANSVTPRYSLPAFRMNKLMGIMCKINDDAVGRVYPNGKIDKAPTQKDLGKLKRGSDIAKEILVKCGVDPKSLFVTAPSGAHPGGTAAIGKAVDKNLETKLKGLYVCDASVLPFAPGLPPMLSLIALTKWFAKRIAGV